MNRPRAVLWDVDGTMAETERDGHRVAFNLAFERHGIPWRWDDAHYGALLAVAGGRERLLHDMQSRGDAPTPAEREQLARELHATKNAIYAELVGAGAIPLREGVAEMIDECAAAGVRQAITTTTSASNLDALLRAQLGAGWRARFDAVVCGEDVKRKKPDPEVYTQALSRLGLPAIDAVALEDSPGGVAAAIAAGVPVVVTLSAYFVAATIEGAIAIGPGLHRRSGWRPALAGSDGRVTLADLAEWCAAMDSVSQFG